MTIDGGLRTLFRRHLPMLHWTSVETGATARGVPDSNWLAEGGVEGWIEYKATRGAGMAVGSLSPEQAAWMHRRARLGGRAWLAVRRDAEGDNELWMVPGALAQTVRAGGLGAVEAWWDAEHPRAAPRPQRCHGQHGGRWPGGPARWDWVAVLACLLARPARP